MRGHGDTIPVLPCGLLYTVKSLNSGLRRSTGTHHRQVQISSVNAGQCRYSIENTGYTSQSQTDFLCVVTEKGNTVIKAVPSDQYPRSPPSRNETHALRTKWYESTRRHRIAHLFSLASLIKSKSRFTASAICTAVWAMLAIRTRCSQ
jgi:hypothetical protein